MRPWRVPATTAAALLMALLGAPSCGPKGADSRPGQSTAQGGSRGSEGGRGGGSASGGTGGSSNGGTAGMGGAAGTGGGTGAAVDAQNDAALPSDASPSSDAIRDAADATPVPAGQLLHVAPNGQGTDCSQATPCDLATARDRARTVVRQPGPLVIRLRGGTYALTKPFELRETEAIHDSGRSDSPTVYEAAPGETPIVSGGVAITGWQIADAVKGIYRAKAPAGLRTRQLFINGERGMRARGAHRPPGYVLTTAGVTAPTDEASRFKTPTTMEAVAGAGWRTMRCGVAGVVGRNITFRQPCWANSNLTRMLPGGGWPPGSLFWLENAYELLDQPGEWYLDEAAGDVFYKPRAGEDMATVPVIAPVAEGLVDARGTPDRPIHDVTFRGITFAFSGWLRPSGPEGSATWQACYDVTGPRTVQPGFDDLTRMPSAVTLASARGFRMEGNQFVRLGASALSIEGGGQKNVVLRNQFDDVSGCGIQLGEVSVWAANTPDANRTRDNSIEHNTLQRIGAEFHGGIGIFVGFSENTLVAHNEISNSSYTGISLGWAGWNPAYGFGGTGSHGDPTYARGNRIIANKIHDVLNFLVDGGGIYTQGAQPDSAIENNHIATVGKDGAAFGIYLDEGTQNFHVAGNVLAKVQNETIRCWNTATPNQNKNNVLEKNFGDKAFSTMIYENISRNNVVVTGPWPPEAMAVIEAAGPKPP